MPISHVEGKEWTYDHAVKAQPSKIYDVGPGVGTYSDLLRSSTKAHWVGIEVWEPYIEEYALRSKYDEVVRQDARDYPFGYDRNSLILFGDVIEHMDEFDSKQLLRLAKQASKYVLVSIPIMHCEQGAVNGNPYEAHVRHWGFEEMHELMDYCDSWRGDVLACYWWERK